MKHPVWKRWHKITLGVIGAFLVLVIAAIALSDEDSSTSPPDPDVASKPVSEEVSPAEEKRRMRDADHAAAIAVIQAAVRGSLGSGPQLGEGEAQVECGFEKCRVQYPIVKLWGNGLDDGLVNAQRDVWETMFALPNVKAGTITLTGDVETIGAVLKEPGPFLRVTCTRDAARKISWAEVDRAGMEALCDWEELVQIDGEIQ